LTSIGAQGDRNKSLISRGEDRQQRGHLLLGKPAEKEGIIPSPSGRSAALLDRWQQRRWKGFANKDAVQIRRNLLERRSFSSWQWAQRIS